jgi:hypothetical protein
MEAACRDSIALRWITGNNIPDHNTLWMFGRDNKKALREVIKQSVRVAAKNNLIGMVLFAVDGCKVKARASNASAYHRSLLEKALKKVDESIKDMEEEMEKGTGTGEHRLPENLADTKARKEAIQRALAELEEAGTKHLSPAEPDARMMKCEGQLQLAYNAQAVVDSKINLCVGLDVYNQETDHGLLATMIENAKQTIGDGWQKTEPEEPKTSRPEAAPASEDPVTVADKGYSSARDLAEAEEQGHQVLVSLSRQVSPPEGTEPFHSSRFSYDPKRNCCICPLGNTLSLQRSYNDSERGNIRVYHCDGYKDCPSRDTCSQNKRGRTIKLSDYSHAVQHQRELQQDPDNCTKLKLRAGIVEPLFAYIKDNLGLRIWSFRDLEGVKTQWALINTVINLRKLYHFWKRGDLVLV